MGDAIVKRYSLDAQRSRFTVQAFAAGMLGGFAHDPKFAIRQFEGELKFAAESAEKSSFILTVKAASLDQMDIVKQSDRDEIQKKLLDEVLEAAKYPQINYCSTEISLSKIAENWYRVQIRGEMDLHGVTRPMPIDSQLRFADREMRLTGEFMLLFAHYRIKRVTGLGGMIKIKDELKFQFNLVGQEQE